MRMDQLPYTEFSDKTLENCQKWRDENYERNTKIMNRNIQSQAHNKQNSKYVSVTQPRSCQRISLQLSAPPSCSWPHASLATSISLRDLSFLWLIRAQIGFLQQSWYALRPRSFVILFTFGHQGQLFHTSLGQNPLTQQKPLCKQGFISRMLCNRTVVGRFEVWQINGSQSRELSVSCFGTRSRR